MAGIRYFLLLAALAFFTIAGAQPRIGDAVLQINTGGHLSQISETVTTADGKYIISSSTDKTICIWDVQSKKLIDQIRGPKSVFNQGKLFSLAISPDSRFLAVGGFLAIGTETDGDLAGQIRIYDFAARKLLLRLKGHSNVVTTLRFSADGKFLISGATDSSIIFWKVSGSTDKPSFTFAKRIVQSDFFVEDIQTFGNSVLVTEGRHLVKYSLPSMTRKSFSKNYQGNILSIAVNRDKNMVVLVTNQNALAIMDTILNEKQFIRLNGYSTRAAISPNADYIVTEDKDSKIKFMVKKGTSYSSVGYVDFPGGSTMLGMGFLGNTEFYVAGGTLNLLQFYNIKDKAIAASGIMPGVTLSGSGRTFTGISVYDNKLALKDTFSTYKNYQHTFYPDAGRLLDFNPADSDLYPENRTQRDNLKLLVGNDYTTLYIYSGDSVIGTIERDGGNGYMHICATITKKHYIISGSAAGFLNIYDSTGRMLAAFVGHEGDVRSISESADGDFLYSTSLDQTTRMWDLRQIKDQISFVTFAELSSEWKQFIAESYPDFDSTKTSSVEKLYHEMMNTGSKENAAYLIKPQYIEPRLNIFIAKNNEWVIWNNKGYFKASSNGAAYIGWYVYNGEDKNGEFYTADKLYDNYYRPDIINRLLLSGETAADILKDIKDSSRLSIVQQISNMPVLKLERPAVSGIVTDKSVNLVFSVENKDNLGDILLFQNGKRITVSTDKIRGLKVNTLTIPVELVSGENKFTVSALNKSKAESSPVKFNLSWAGATPASTLYILSVGVDKYRNTKYNLNYARADASGIALQLAHSATTIFKRIQVDSLFDENATLENLRNKLEALEKIIRPEDVFLFFYAGHGVMNDPVDGSKPDFQLVLHKVTQMEGNEMMLKENAMSASSLKDLLLKIPAQKQLILLDACNSGGALTTFTRGVGEEAAIFQLARSTGFTVLSSTNQEQFASEVKALGHGIFTYALLNGLNGEADIKKDGKITVLEIELYINEVIPMLSEKYKGAQQFPQSFSRGMDFPLTIKAN